MRNKGFTIIEGLAIFIIVGIVFLIFVAIVNGDGITPEQQMEWCMDEYEDFDYCKYKLGVQDEFRQSN